MKINLTLFVSGLLLITAFVNAQDNVIFSNDNNEQNLVFQSSSFDNFHVASKTNDLFYQIVEVKGHSFVQLGIEDYVKTTKIGEPELPVLSKIIQIPEDAELVIKNVSYEEQEIKLSDFNVSNQIKPIQTPVFKSENPDVHPFVMNESLYQSDEFYGNELVKVEILGHLRNYRLAKVTISPVKYNPAINSLKVYSNITFDIVSNNANKEKTENLTKIYKSPYFRAIGEKVQGNLLKSKDVISKVPVKYVIVSDIMFQDALQPFIEWKKQKGFIVVEAYTNDPAVGDTRGEIKSYLKSLYESATEDDPAPTFCLLVGDVDQIEPWDGLSDYHVTDLYYFEYTDDDFPEVYYGRMSANNVEELQPQLDKTIEYEKYLMEDPSFLENVLMVSGVDGSFAPTYGNGQINYGTVNYFNEDNTINSYTYLYPESGSSRQAILNNVSSGVSFGNYTAHCSASGWADPSFLVSDVAGLTNAGKYPTLIGNCCQSGDFNSTACFGEKLLRAEGRGAVGYIGASNLSLWDEDYYFGVGAGPISANPTYEQTGLGLYDRLFHIEGEDNDEWFITNGQMLMAGNLAVTEGATSYVLYYWEMYHLFGDPSLMTYLGIPADLEVNYIESFPVGLTDFEVNTEPYSYVALTRDGVFVAAAETDANGNAILDISSLVEPGVFDLVATKQNHKPFIAEISAVPSNSPYVIYKGHVVKDTEGAEKLDIYCGEEVHFDIDVSNVGSVDGDNVVLKLRSTDSYVQLVDSVEEILSITGGEQLTLANAFSIIVNDMVPDQHTVSFSIVASDGSNEWTSSYSIKLNAPLLSLSNMSIDDAAVGNGNRILDPGELSSLIFEVENTGHYKSDEIEINLSFNSQNAELFANQFQMSELEVQSNDSKSVFVGVSPDCPIGEIMEISFSLSSGAYNLDTTLYFKVGEFIDDFETNDFSLYEWREDQNHPWSIVESFDGVLPISGSYMAQSAPLTTNQSSDLTIELNVLANDSISFYKKVSCEDGNGAKYDFLEFFIDGASQDWWDGEAVWEQHKYPVSAGTHTFLWRYYKDGSVAEGHDKAWIDKIVLPVHENTITNNNNIPLFISSPITTARRFENYNYNIVVQDEDVADELTLQIFEAPEFLFLENIEGNYSLNGTPAGDYYGEYTVMLSVSDSKSFNYQSYVLNVTPGVAIEEMNNTAIFDFYPNPSTGEVFIETVNITHGLISVFNMVGQKLNEFEINEAQTKIDLSGLGKGIYFIELSYENIKSTKRIVIVE